MGGTSATVPKLAGLGIMIVSVKFAFVNLPALLVGIDELASSAALTRPSAAAMSGLVVVKLADDFEGSTAWK